MNTPLKSRTYKIKPPVIDDAIYITIADNDSGPEWIFINCKNMASYQWISFITQLISDKFSSLDELQNVIKIMKNTHDTGGGYVIPKSKGVHAKSIVAHIGYVLEKHIENNLK